MKAIVINHFVESYNEIQVSNIPIPEPRDDEILIQVKAAGVNFVDTLYARGKHQNNRRHIKPPFTLGLEFSGIVLSSPQNSPFPPGSHVFGSHSGCYAEYILIPSPSPSSSSPSSSSSLLHQIPTGWTFASAASIAATLPVSHGALVRTGNLLAGETVLIHAAAGGLGLAAVQVAKATGCKVIGTAGTDEKCSIAMRYGADACINYRTETEWWEKVLEMTDGKGVDIVFDTVGLVNLSLKCLAHRGRILVVGFAGREGGRDMEDVKMNRVLLKQAQILGYRYGETSRRYPEETKEIWRDVYQMIEEGAFKPTLFGKTYMGLESVPEALADVASRKVWGKAVIQVDTSPGDEHPVRGRL
ncbi:quinone oxidoreductase [Xylaria flabelliformis]|nr:quinone oxidoreductase [Xylaria flabelliformis]